MSGFIGLPGLIILGVLLLLVFGPKRLPEMGRSVGRGMHEFKDSLTGSDDRPELPVGREVELERADQVRLEHERRAA